MKKILLCALSIAMMSCSLFLEDVDKQKQEGDIDFTVRPNTIVYTAEQKLGTSKLSDTENALYTAEMNETLETHVYNTQTKKGLLRFNRAITIIPQLFDNCPSITEVALPTTLRELSGAALRGTNITTLVVPDSVKEIGNYALAECHELRKVTFPAGLTKIGTHALENTGKLDTMVFLGTTPPWCYSDAMFKAGYFAVIGDTTKVLVPKGCIEAYKKAICCQLYVFAFREME